MRLTLFLIFLGVLGVSAGTKAQQTKFSLNYKETAIKQILNDLKSKSDFEFVYSNDDFDVNKPVDISVNNETVFKILDEILNDTGMKYNVVDNLVIIAPKTMGDFSRGVQDKKKVSGKVTDSSGQPMPGVAVMLKNTGNGTVSNTDGFYSLTDVPAKSIIVFSFVGMKTQEIVLADKDIINIVLEEENFKVDEVVVTALGISREKKALGYSVQGVQGEEIINSKESNVIKALTGKISGLNISQGDGNIGPGMSRIVIRGETSLAGNNTPLYVIDGVPNWDINNISPYDIETISVLKGPAAAALYGSKAGPGVILITTKRASKKELQIEINSNVSIANIGIIPEVQTTYGQGENGSYKSLSSWSWGPKFEGQKVQQLYGTDVWKANDNFVQDFYDTGVTYNNNIAVSSSNSVSHFRLSFSDLRQKGMVPTSKYDETRIDINTGRKLFEEKLNFNLNIKYRKVKSKNGSNMDVRKLPRNLDLELLKDYWIEENVKQRQWRDTGNNMYFDLYENEGTNQQDIINATASLNYDFTSKLSLMLRSGVNARFGKGESKKSFANYGTDQQFGAYSTAMDNYYELNNEWLLTYKNDFNDFSVVASAGGNMFETNYNTLNSGVNQMLIPDSYNLGNHRVYPWTSNAYNIRKKINALYGFVNLGYKNYVYLDLTARNDWTSTLLYKKNDSIFYPSASLSVLFNNIFAMNEKIDLLKLKVNYAEVGNSTDPYQLDPFISWAGGANGQASISEDKTKPEKNLKPERTKSFEIGAQLTMFKNRINIDATYYNSLTSNQIWRMKVSPISGYDYAIRNIGEIKNNGVEITLNATPIKTHDFQWDATINWALDRTSVTKLDPENPEYAITKDIAGGIYSYDYVGERRGALYSTIARRFEYDPKVHDASLAKHNGKLYFDGGKDLPWSSEKEIVGNYNPDWNGSFINTFRYKNFTLSAMLYVNYGNTFYNIFEKEMVQAGLDPRTAEGRETGYLPDAVWDSPDGVRAFQPGDEVDAEDYWSDFMVDYRVNDIWLTDGSFMKLKNMSMSYDLPKQWVRKLNMNKISVGITGQNLYVWSKVKNVDPETFVQSPSGNIPGFAEGYYLAPPKTFTFNLNISL